MKVKISFKRRIMAFTLVLAMLLSIILCRDTVSAGDISSPLVFDDENEILIFESYDKKVGGPKIPCYRTLGFSITRCRPGNVEENPDLQVFDETVFFVLPEEGEEDNETERYVEFQDSSTDSKGYVTTRWILHFDKFKKYLRENSYDSWCDDLEDTESEEDVYIRMDAIMTTCTVFGTNTERQPQAILKGDNITGEWSVWQKDFGHLSKARIYAVPYVKEHCSTPELVDAVRWEESPHSSELIGAYEWGNTSRIDDHFRKFVLLKNKKIKPQEDPIPPEKDEKYNWGKPDAKLTQPQTTPPVIVTPDPEDPEKTPPDEQGGETKTVTFNVGDAAWNVYNTSPDFDLAKGIPSSENITNGVNCNTWFGAGTMGKKSINSGKIYETPVEITRVTRSPHSCDTPGCKTKWNYRRTVGHTHVCPIRQASYYYISDIELYGFKKARVENDVYGGYQAPEHLDYEAYPDTLEYKVSVNGDAVTKNRSFSFDNFTPNNKYHVSWYGCNDNWEVDPQYVKEIKISYNAWEESRDSAVSRARKIAENRIKEATVRNDHLEINKKIYMNEADVDLNRESGPSNWLPVGGELEYGPLNGLHQAEGNTGVGKENHEQTVQISANKANGYYPTSATITYSQFAGPAVQREKVYSGSGRSIISAEPETRNADHPNRWLKANEPVYVHTPVVSPVYIGEDNGDGDDTTWDHLSDERQKNQLARPDSGLVDYELKLDEQYQMVYDAWEHREIQNYGDSGKPIKYNKYTMKKQVRFPFAVKVNDMYWSPSRDPSSANYGFTPWIDTDFEDFAFYIPTWAEEGLYGARDDNHFNPHDEAIEIRVIPINAVPAERENAEVDHIEDTQDSANLDISKYVAYFKVPVELSGIMYGLEVTGISDEGRFKPEEEYASINIDNHVSGFTNFVQRKEEHKVGTKNRIGGDEVRYTLTKGIAQGGWKEVNTLPFASGKSNAYPEAGYLVRGDSFTYTLETIGILSGKEDKLEITPTFRYIHKTGKGPHDWEEKDVNVYYNSNTSMFIPLQYTQVNPDGSPKIDERDKKLKLKLSDPRLSGTYNNAQVYFTCREDRKIKEKPYLYPDGITFQKVECGSKEFMSLNSDLRLLVGAEEKVAWDDYFFDEDGKGNLQRDAAKAITYRQACDEERSGMPYDINKDDFDERFGVSMQKWFGLYEIPNYIFICDKSIDVPEKIRNGAMISQTEDFWYDSRGYLILNFDIKSVKNGKDHLRYYGGGGEKPYNMWKTENAQDKVNVGFGNLRCEDVPMYDGDIAIISMTEAQANKWAVRLLWLN